MMFKELILTKTYFVLTNNLNLILVFIKTLSSVLTNETRKYLNKNLVM